MKNIINKIFSSYMSGLISAVFLYFVMVIIKNQSIFLNHDSKENLYSIMIFGGVWSLLFILPLAKNIFIKSSIIGLIVIFFNFLVKMPISGEGFFSIHAGFGVFITNIYFNFIWAILAGMIYIFTKENNR